MAPLSQAIKSEFAYVRHDETYIFKGTVDPDWCIGNVPHGGYIVSILLAASLLHQATTEHPDPAHLTAQFLSASTPGPHEVHLKAFSTTRRWTRLDVCFYQPQPPPRESERPILRVRSYFLFANLPELGTPSAPNPMNVTVLPHSTSPFARLCPLLKRPEECVESPLFPGFEGEKHVRWAELQGILGETKDVTELTTGEKLEWGAWVEFRDESEDITLTSALIPFFADFFRNGPEQLPKEQRPGPSWFPTLSFSMDFLSKFPLAPCPLSEQRPGELSKRTVGVFSTTNFIHEGRHDNTVEVWTSPAEIGATRTAPAVDGDWRKESQILAVSTQLSLVLDYQVNLRNGVVRL